LKKPLRFDSSWFVINPDVDWKGNSVTFEPVGSEEEGDKLGDLETDALFVGKFLATSADNDGVSASFERVSYESKAEWVCGPGFVEVDGDGHTGFQVL
jgi:hypothetical protein